MGAVTPRSTDLAGEFEACELVWNLWCYTCVYESMPVETNACWYMCTCSYACIHPLLNMSCQKCLEFDCSHFYLLARMCAYIHMRTYAVVRTNVSLGKHTHTYSHMNSSTYTHVSWASTHTSIQQPVPVHKYSWHTRGETWQRQGLLLLMRSYTYACIYKYAWISKTTEYIEIAEPALSNTHIHTHGHRCISRTHV